METMERVFQHEKETSNTVRFKEDTDDAPVIGSLYVQKWAVRKLGNPQKIKVIISNEA